MTENLDSKWAEPRQARAQASMDRMLDAAQSLLENMNFHDLKVQDVVKHAETSIGSFYNRFKTKDGLLRCLEERYVSERNRIVERELKSNDWTNVDLRPRVRWLARLIVRFNRERRGLFRTVRTRQILGEATWDEQDLEEHRSLCGRYFDFLLECKGEMAHPEPEKAVMVGFISMVVMLDQMLLFDHTLIAAGVGLNDEQLATEVGDQLLAYLGCPRIEA